MIFSSDLSRVRETAYILGKTLEERINKWGKDWESLSLGIEHDDSIVYRGTSFALETMNKFQDKKY